MLWTVSSALLIQSSEANVGPTISKNDSTGGRISVTRSCPWPRSMVRRASQKLGTVFTSTSSESGTSTSGQLRHRRRLHGRGRRRLDTEESDYSWSSSTLEELIDGTEFVLGYLDLEITEASLSLSTLKEINPLNILDIFGNIGGLWGACRDLA